MAAPAKNLPSPNDPVQVVRRFNRFYTRQIGVLQEHLLHSQFSLTEVRVLYELAHRENVTAIELRDELGLDRGYLSRMLQHFEKHGWLKATHSSVDRRRIFLALTGKGRKVFAPLDRRSTEEVAAMLTRLSIERQEKLLAAMHEIEGVLDGGRETGETPVAPPPGAEAPKSFLLAAGLEAVPSQGTSGLSISTDELTGRRTSSTRAAQGLVSPTALAAEGTPEQTPLESADPAFILRRHHPGDMGWVVQRHGELYWKEYRYDERFEALVAEIVAEFIQEFDPKREHCWIAEKEGERVGAIFLVKKSKTVAKLRLLLVEPSARGLGIGKRLVSECVNFARKSRYKKILLWTQSELHTARHLYEQAGFKRVEQKPHQSWGRKDLVAETWELKL